MKTLKIKITKIARKTCADYSDNHNCLLCTAIRRQIKGAKPFMGTEGGDILFPDGSAMQYRLEEPHKIHNAYIPGRFKPFTATLTPTNPSWINKTIFI